MMTLEVVVADGPTVELLASGDLEQRIVRTLPELAGFVADRADGLSSGQIELLGRLAAVLAWFDPAAVTARDARSLDKIVDSYYFDTGPPEMSSAFDRGLAEALRHLQLLWDRPDADQVKQVLQVA
jgi:hypothetical protein